jgi:hypothetical protein
MMPFTPLWPICHSCTVPSGRVAPRYWFVVAQRIARCATPSRITVVLCVDYLTLFHERPNFISAASFE